MMRYAMVPSSGFFQNQLFILLIELVIEVGATSGILLLFVIVAE